MRILIICTMAPMLLVAGCSRQSAEDRARQATSKGTEVVEGVGEGLSKAGNKAGKVMGEGLGAFFSGVGEGVEKSMTTRDVRISEELKAKGVSVTVTTYGNVVGTNQGQHALSIYVVTREAITGNLRIKLFNGASQEIGRAASAAILPADDAKYVQFLLDKEIPVLMTKFIELDLKKE